MKYLFAILLSLILCSIAYADRWYCDGTTMYGLEREDGGVSGGKMSWKVDYLVEKISNCDDIPDPWWPISASGTDRVRPLLNLRCKDGETYGVKAVADSIGSFYKQFYICVDSDFWLDGIGLFCYSEPTALGSFHMSLPQGVFISSFITVPEMSAVIATGSCRRL